MQREMLKEQRVNGVEMQRVFMNLFVNAIQAIEGFGKIRIATEQKGEQICIRVSDTGKGIREQDLGKVFDPGFTTRQSGVGSGLGLSISFNIIKKHHGRIEVDSEPDKGAEFTIWLPAGKETED